MRIPSRRILISWAATLKQPDAWRPFAKPPPEAPELNLEARAQAFLKRIAPLSADLAARGHTRALALQKPRRICQAEVRKFKADHTPATVKFYLSKYRDAIRQLDPDHLVLRPRKMRSSQRFSYLALEPEETRRINAAYHQRIQKDQASLIPLDPEAFIQTALDFLASDRYLEKGMGLMALTGRRPAEIFFSASFSLPKRNSPSQPSSSVASSKPATLPAPALSLTQSLFWPSQRRSSRPSIDSDR
jgi:hypothetical protein